MLISRRWLPGLLCLTFIASFPRAAIPAAPANAKALLERALKAHRNLGPCLIHFTGVTQSYDGPKKIVQATLQWNDANHYVVHMKNAGGHQLAVYVNGADQVAVSHERRKWIRLRIDNSEHVLIREMLKNAMPNPLLNKLAHLFLDEAGGRAFAHYPLTGTTIDGVPCSRFYVPTGSTPDGSTAYVALACGRSDGLMRKFAARSENDDETRITVQYTKRKDRFPKQTFTFKAPAGYSETSDIMEGEG